MKSEPLENAGRDNQLAAPVTVSQVFVGPILGLANGLASAPREVGTDFPGRKGAVTRVRSNARVVEVGCTLFPLRPQPTAGLHGKPFRPTALPS